MSDQSIDFQENAKTGHRQSDASLLENNPGHFFGTRYGRQNIISTACYPVPSVRHAQFRIATILLCWQNWNWRFIHNYRANSNCSFTCAVAEIPETWTCSVFLVLQTMTKATFNQKFMMDADQNNLQNIYTPLTLKKHWVL